MMAANPILETFEKEFGRLVNKNARLDAVYTECRWAEGPVWFGDGNFLLWSDIPNDRILRFIPGVGTSEFRTQAGNTNGHTRDREGRLVSCSHGNRRLERTEHDGTITVLADSFEGKRLNSPNDVVVKSDGTIWFTDPAYGIDSDYEGHKAEQEQDGCYVFCFDPANGKLELAVSDFERPNGLAFSPDESILYIADSGGPNHIREFRVDANNHLSGGEVFTRIDIGVPDGFRLDTGGNIWTTAGDGVRVYTPSATLLGRIVTPKVPANLTFAGPKKNWLFIAATDSMLWMHTMANGVQVP